jgi:hypothetical protein
MRTGSIAEGGSVDVLATGEHLTLLGEGRNSSSGRDAALRAAEG